MAQCPYLGELRDNEENIGDYDRYCFLCNCRLKSNDALVREVCSEPNDEFQNCPMYKDKSTILKVRREKVCEVRCG